MWILWERSFFRTILWLGKNGDVAFLSGFFWASNELQEAMVWLDTIAYVTCVHLAVLITVVSRTGISTIRLPLTWAAFADALAPLSPVYASFDPERETALVPDPFYHDKIALATIPRKTLVDFLHKASHFGLTVIFDLHAFPGGSQDGTYNSVWPNRPVFWSEQTQLGNPATAVPLSMVGRWVVQALIRWVETLDAGAKKAVAGLTLMNEPAHTNAWGHFAEEKNVLTWLSETSEDFRTSSLPLENVKLYVNLIETAFSETLGKQHFGATHRIVGRGQPFELVQFPPGNYHFPAGTSLSQWVISWRELPGKNVGYVFSLPWRVTYNALKKKAAKPNCCPQL